jgi:hypothetical protein
MLVGHIGCRKDGPLTESAWREAETRALQMLERAVMKLGRWYPYSMRRVHDPGDHFIRVEMKTEPE